MFELPTLTPGIDPTLPADKKQLAEWLRQGEGRDVSTTIRRVYDLLKRLNRTELADKTRFAMLELLAAPIADISATLERHYAGLDQPLPAPNRKIAHRLGRLIRQYSFGYQRLVMVASAQRSRLDQAGIYAIAHGRVMSLCADCLMVYYRAYLAPPAGIWKDMHQTYQQAKSFVIHQLPPTDKSSQYSLEQIYLTALLCDLADPYRLAAGDIDRVRQYILNYLHLCLVDRGSQVGKKASLFVVHFGIDAGAHEVGDIILRDDKDGFLFDTSKLVKLIHQQLAELGHRPAAVAQWQEHKNQIVMLRCLVVAFASQPNRQQERSSANGELWVLRGVTAVHAHIAAGSVTDGSLPEIELEYSGGHPVIPIPQAGNQIHHWDLLDQSPGGFALLREATGQARVAIGDLLAISPGPDGPWQTGIVKRVRYRGEEDLIVGVQKLAEGAEAVIIIAAQENDQVPGLFYRGQNEPATGATLLLPLGGWSPGESVTVKKLGALQLGRIIELTGQFEMFEVTAL